MRLESFRNAFRHGLVAQAVFRHLRRLGIVVVVYYLVAEGDFHPEAGWGDRFAAYTPCELGPDDMAELAPTRPWIPEDALRARLRAGHVCIGLRHKGALAAYTWADPHECHHQPNRFTLAPGEAYLYEAWTMAAFRGRNLAPFMRERCYAVLRARGFTRFYSITEYFNASASRFKQKLNARPVTLSLYVEVARRWRHNWILKSWPNRASASAA